MKQINYVIQFRGSAGPKEGQEGVLGAKSTGASSTISTSVDSGGVDATIEAAAGGSATFVSDVFPNEDGSFTESGTIDFGGGNSFAFSTRGTGEMGPCADPNLTHGGICWKIDSGTGHFDGATGIITSNFTVSSSGEVVDSQWGVIFLN
jgi:hypothetical protein